MEINSKTFEDIVMGICLVFFLCLLGTGGVTTYAILSNVLWEGVLDAFYKMGWPAVLSVVGLIVTTPMFFVLWKTLPKEKPIDTYSHHATNTERPHANK